GGWGAGGWRGGGGKAGADCEGGFDVQGASGSNKVTCTDGEPGCDTDSACQGTCTFRVAVCLNQTNVSGCTPKPLKKPAKAGAPLVPPSVLDGSAACGEFVDVPVTLKGGAKHNKKNVKRIKLTAIVNGKPARETDKLTLICQPRNGACPTTTTTTTTTSTTTTTVITASTSTTSTTTTSTTTTTFPCNAAATFHQLRTTNVPGTSACGGPA